MGVRDSRWKSSLIDGGQEMPKGSHHKTDLTQEVYREAGVCLWLGIKSGICNGGDLTKHDDCGNASHSVSGNDMSTGVVSLKADWGSTWPLTLSYRKCQKKSMDLEAPSPVWLAHSPLDTCPLLAQPSAVLSLEGSDLWWDHSQWDWLFL